ncbi:MAG: GvpL/GvpF family gas vesicle protein [Nitrospirae bacterium]|nr:GvpL/GvpF family gas vesicle protein [Nitrospirota bacterium]
MAEIGQYIYGIINSTPPTRPLGEVYAISYRDISAVVSDSEIVDYTHLPKDTLARHLLRHQEIIERIMTEHTIIPMRLGTFANDSEEVKEILTKGYRMIKEIFKRAKNIVEIDVVAIWSDFNSILKEVSEEEGIKEFKQALLSSKEGIAVDDQMRIGVLVKDYLDKKREGYANEIQTSLSRIAEGFKAHDLMDDEMVLNTAFLMSNARIEDFDRKLEELNARFGERLNFRCVGPLPPYSFYTLQIKKLKFEDIDWARRKLSLLNDFITKDEIKKAYQTLAFSFHPDRNPDTPGIEKEFDEVTKAYRVLWEYCQEEVCSFNEQDFKKNALLVKIRG